MRRVGLVLILMALWVVVGVPRLVGAAQDGTPETTPAAGCDVEAIAIGGGMREARATPAAEVLVPEDGPAADAETVADLQGTLDELDACVAEGDIGKIAALFTEEGFAREVMGVEPVQIEPVQIEPVQIEPTPAGATPAADGTTRVPPVVEPGVIDRAVVLEDGSMAAYVDSGTGAPQLIVFVQEDGRWVIDAIEPLAPEATPVRPLGAEDVPAEVWEAVVATLGLTENATITVVELEAVDWPDSSLGCPVDGEFYAQVITPGFRIVVEVGGQRTELHTDLEGNVVGCENTTSS